jgi:hypothetical protein
MEEKRRRGGELRRRGGPNPHLESSFPWRRTQITTRGKPRTERPSREREIDWKNYLGERVSGLFMKTDIPV